MLRTFVGTSVVIGVSIVAIMRKLGEPKSRMSIDRDYINKKGALINTKMDKGEVVEINTVKHNGLECLQDKGYELTINENFMKSPIAWHTSIKIRNKQGGFIDIRDFLEDCKTCNVNSELSYSYSDTLTFGEISRTEVVEWCKCEVPYKVV